MTSVLMDPSAPSTAPPRQHPQRTPQRRTGHLSTRGWYRLRRSVTVGIFAAATVVGITLGINAVDVSPVAAPAPSVVQQVQNPGVPTVVPAPPGPAVDPGPTGRGIGDTARPDFGQGRPDGGRQGRSR